MIQRYRLNYIIKMLRIKFQRFNVTPLPFLSYLVLNLPLVSNESHLNDVISLPMIQTELLFELHLIGRTSICLLWDLLCPRSFNFELFPEFIISCPFFEKEKAIWMQTSSLHLSALHIQPEHSRYNRPSKRDDYLIPLSPQIENARHNTRSSEGRATSRNAAGCVLKNLSLLSSHPAGPKWGGSLRQTEGGVAEVIISSLSGCDAHLSLILSNSSKWDWCRGKKQINTRVPPCGARLMWDEERLESQLSRTLPPKEIIHILISY